MQGYPDIITAIEHLKKKKKGKWNASIYFILFFLLICIQYKPIRETDFLKCMH